jgi:lysophospholipase L1-like esterase
MPGSGRSTARPLLLRLLAGLLPLLALVAVAEIGLRAAGYDPIGNLAKRQRTLRLSADRDLRYEPVPNSRGGSRKRPIEINSDGFRDQHYPMTKRAGVYRAVVLGDSIAFGTGLGAEQRFSEVLERRLQNEGRAVDVLNLGVAGYDTLNEVAFLERVGLRFDPDLVILSYCVNDIGVHSHNLKTLRRLESYGALLRASRIVQFVFVQVDRLTLLQQLRALNSDEVFRQQFEGRIAPVGKDAQVQRRREELARMLDRYQPEQPPFLAWYTSDVKIGRLRYAFERLRRAADDNGFEVVVLSIPYLGEAAFAEAYRAAYDLVAHEAERLGFRVLSVREAFLRHGVELLLLRDPLHPNEVGHRIIASELYRSLEEHWGEPATTAPPQP